MCREREQFCVAELLNCSRINPQKKRETRGQTLGFIATPPWPDAPGICDVAIVLGCGSTVFQAQETFLGYSILWLL